MVVYADVIFVINFISSYIMLYLLGKLALKVKINKLRLCIASAVGGLSAAIIFSMEIMLVWAYFMRILSVFIMVFTTFFEHKRQIISQVLWLALISAVMTAAMLLLAALSGRTTTVIIKAGVIYFDLPQKIFLPLFAISYAAVTIFMKLLQNRRSKKRYLISVTLGDKTITITALFDSGNLLKEPVTGKCVSIVEWNAARKLFDIECEFGDIMSYAESLRLWAIPFHSLGNKSGILFAFLADRIDIPEEKKVVENTFIGLYGESLSKNNEYQALLNAALL